MSRWGAWRSSAIGAGGSLVVLALHASIGACNATSREFDPADAGSEAEASAPPAPFDEVDAGDAGPGRTVSVNPRTCEEAAAASTYVGCDFWPTVTFNVVWDVFDYVVVLANTGTESADYTITGPNGFSTSGTVAVGMTEAVYLPWVAALKGPEFDECVDLSTKTESSVLVKGGAYHVTTTRPVTAYQFNALEYAGVGGPPGKDWSSCPGLKACGSGADDAGAGDGGISSPLGCYSYTNDASLLLPTTAMSTSYRILGPGALTRRAFIAIVATEDATKVRLRVRGTVEPLPGTTVAADGTYELMMDRGDVAELVTPDDVSGSLLQSDKPVEVLTGNSCTFVGGVPACDHLEETVLPIEAVGRAYVVGAPAAPATEGPFQGPVEHHVVFQSSVDKYVPLEYQPKRPEGCPEFLNQAPAGCKFDQDTVVTAPKPFAIHSLLYGARIVDPSGILGDPSQTTYASIEQFRTSYVFLAPPDYAPNFAIVSGEASRTFTIDGKPYTLGPPIGSSEYGVARVLLEPTAGGLHRLTSDTPVSLNVMGYGRYTSYAYPAGLDLRKVAPPAPVF